jgi:ribosome-binding protein aMBF1 (putative translation factor)
MMAMAILYETMPNRYLKTSEPKPLRRAGSWRLRKTTVSGPKQNLKILGDTIRDYRDRAGMSQETLAEKADLHPVYIGKIERGEQWVSLHALLRVARALRVRVRNLVDEL